MSRSRRLPVNGVNPTGGSNEVVTHCLTPILMIPIFVVLDFKDMKQPTIETKSSLFWLEF